LRAGGAELVVGEGRFIDAHTIAVGERLLEGKAIVIATGARTPRLPIEGIELADSHVELLTLCEPPPRLVVIGGGVIGIEFAFMFARVGVEVTVVELLDHLLGRADEDVRAAVGDAAARLGIQIHLSTAVQRLGRDGDAFTVLAEGPQGPLALEAERVLLAAGMVPAVDGLDLERAGVSYDAHGIPTDQTLRTNLPHIFAVGDVRAGAYQLSPVATSEGLIAGANALQDGQATFDERIVPYLIGVTPPAAGVGLTEQEARAQGLDVDIHRQDYKDVCPVGNVVGEPEGFVKIVAERSTGAILGAHIVGAGAPELIQQIAFAMVGGLTLTETHTLFVFPGLSQALQHALESKPIHDPRYAPGSPTTS
jgi:pyruvate/2-oxoglutarate dehydrogenase complex dihydrolipoamide dehydrogenase (E3) component